MKKELIKDIKGARIHSRGPLEEPRIHSQVLEIDLSFLYSKITKNA
jgi:hypothetical protein